MNLGHFFFFLTHSIISLESFWLRFADQYKRHLSGRCLVLTLRCTERSFYWQFCTWRWPRRLAPSSRCTPGRHNQVRWRHKKSARSAGATSTFTSSASCLVYHGHHKVSFNAVEKIFMIKNKKKTDK